MLSTEVKTFVITTFTGGEFFITDKQENAIKKIGLKDFIKIDGRTIKGSGIAEIITMEDYYRKHPEKRPVKYTQAENIIQTDWTKKKRISVLSSLIRGFKRGCGISPSPRSIRTLRAMNEKLNAYKVEA